MRQYLKQAFRGGQQTPETEDREQVIEASSPHRPEAFSLNSIDPQYEFTRPHTTRFMEQASVTADAGDNFATITYWTPITKTSFDVRINDYTSRFGTLDASHIQISKGVWVYYPVSDEDGFFVRKFFIGEDGISSERINGVCDAPSRWVWKRTDIDEEQSVKNPYCYIKTYDWRRDVTLSSDTKTDDGEIVVIVSDTLGTEKEFVFHQEQHILGEGTAEVQYIRFVPQTEGHEAMFKLYSKGEESDYILTSPFSDESDVEVESVSRIPHVSQVDNIIWVLKPEYTWFE